MDGPVTLLHIPPLFLQNCRIDIASRCVPTSSIRIIAEPMSSSFLTAEWRSLAMLNYEIDPAALQPFVPMGTELAHWQGKTFVAMGGFLLLNARMRGFAVPFHSKFEEVNLRFYVKRFTPEGWRRGVVFIKELVPRRAIA